MIQTLSTIIRISRPHIWLYTAGSLLLGVQVAYVQGYQIDWPVVFTLFVAATLPVNYFIYGLNDYIDVDTDAVNPKKDGLESRFVEKNSWQLYRVALALASVAAAMYAANYYVWIVFFVWLLLVLTYNVPPLRLKAVPGLDMLYAINYPLWGVIGYTQFSSVLPPLSVFGIIALLSFMMHLFSAIPDIEHDQRAGVHTSAVWLRSDTLCISICIIFVLMAGAWLWSLHLVLVTFSVLMYCPFFVYCLMCAGNKRDVKLYKYFLFLQYIIGFLASSALLWHFFI